jgi:hypothetical protein
MCLQILLQIRQKMLLPIHQKMLLPKSPEDAPPNTAPNPPEDAPPSAAPDVGRESDFLNVADGLSVNDTILPRPLQARTRHRLKPHASPHFFRGHRTPILVRSTVVFESSTRPFLDTVSKSPFRLRLFPSIGSAIVSNLTSPHLILGRSFRPRQSQKSEFDGPMQAFKAPPIRYTRRMLANFRENLPIVPKDVRVLVRMFADQAEDPAARLHRVEYLFRECILSVALLNPKAYAAVPVTFQIPDNSRFSILAGCGR